MNIKYKQLSVIFLVVIALLACRKEIDIEVPQNERKIVLNSVLVEGAPITATVYKSKHIQDISYEMPLLPDVTVEVYEDDELVGELSDQGSGFFLIDSVVKVDSEYKLVATHDVLKQVSGVSGVVKSVPIVSFDSVRTGPNQSGWEMLFVQIVIDDPADEENYYRLSIVNLGDGYENSLYLETNDPVIELASYEEVYFSDALFNGSKYAVDLQLDPYYGDYIEEDYEGSSSVRSAGRYAKLESMSRDMYYYAKSVKAQQNVDDFGLFAQPVIVYNNIENGFGIVGSVAANYMEMTK